MSTPPPAPEPGPTVVTVSMLDKFFELFKTWAAGEGFLVAPLPYSDSEDTYIVVPGPRLTGEQP